MNRREFLKNTGLGILAAGVATSPILSACTPKARPKGVSGRLNLSFEPYELKLRHAFNLASMSRTTTPDVQVQIEFDGLVGYGEASMPPYLGESVESVMSFLQSVDLAQFTDPFRMEEILEYVESVAPKNTAAKASIDIALHDLVGKIMGQPWYRIWGLSPENAPETCYTISTDTDDMILEKIDITKPFNMVKIKLGVGEAEDRHLVEIFRREEPTKNFFVDANQGWKDKNHALEMCKWLEEKGCVFIEQPMPKELIDETAWLRERTDLPLIADEFLQRVEDVTRAKGVYDGINIKLMKCTGLREAHKMVTLAQAYGMKLMIGCMTETSCAISAASQLTPYMDWADLDGHVLIANDIFDGMKIDHGKIIIPDRPGIGAIPVSEL